MLGIFIDISTVYEKNIGILCRIIICFLFFKRRVLWTQLIGCTIKRVLEGGNAYFKLAQSPVASETQRVSFGAKSQVMTQIQKEK